MQKGRSRRFGQVKRMDANRLSTEALQCSIKEKRNGGMVWYGMVNVVLLCAEVVRQRVGNENIDRQDLDLKGRKNLNL